MKEGFVHYNVTLRPELDADEILEALFMTEAVEEVKQKQREVVEAALGEWGVRDENRLGFELYKDGTCCWTYRGELIVTFGSHFQNHSPWWVSQSYVVFDRYLPPGPNLERHLHEGYHGGKPD